MIIRRVRRRRLGPVVRLWAAEVVVDLVGVFGDAVGGGVCAAATQEEDDEGDEGGEGYAAADGGADNGACGGGV